MQMAHLQQQALAVLVPGCRPLDSSLIAAQAAHRLKQWLALWRALGCSPSASCALKTLKVLRACRRWRTGATTPAAGAHHSPVLCRALRHADHGEALSAAAAMSGCAELAWRLPRKPTVLWPPHIDVIYGGGK